MKIAHINPDNYLETNEGRVWTPERSKAAWESAYLDFENILKRSSGIADVYIVFGVQGSGKTTWIRNHEPTKPSIYFDAALPAKKHRIQAISIAKKYAKQIHGVWIKVPLVIAKSQNMARSQDKQVSESAIESVFKQLEAPEQSEGFDHQIILSTHL
ncbi:hypothetical protein NX722_03010 [Endozoicomonas gorgoniicola]|uniref:ATP-binding protein n=1 Tax=Endozoicomonas gorgoniicola TaxID=1234144 RepID=A0ABT3MQI0_9GAMM|nr:hypothetical protein [Endozoicomonas gorgoniicola]MCW7551630.1 hypothetical protein [Endozoicomonas gorgoniicola]